MPSKRPRRRSYLPQREWRELQDEFNRRPDLTIADFARVHNIARRSAQRHLSVKIRDEYQSHLQAEAQHLLRTQEGNEALKKISMRKKVLEALLGLCLEDVGLKTPSIPEDLLFSLSQEIASSLAAHTRAHEGRVNAKIVQEILQSALANSRIQTRRRLSPDRACSLTLSICSELNSLEGVGPEGIRLVLESLVHEIKLTGQTQLRELVESSVLELDQAEAVGWAWQKALENVLGPVMRRVKASG